MHVTYGDPERLPGRKRYYSRLYDRSTGRRSWASTGCLALKDAKAWVEARRAEETLGPTIAGARKSSELTVTEAVTRWLAGKEEHVSPERFSGYKGRAEGFWVPFFGAGTKLASVTADDVRRYLAKRKRGLLRSALPRSPADRRKRDREPRPLTAATVNDERGNLAVFFNHAVRSGWLMRSPMFAVDRYEGEIRRRTRYLSPEEEERLLRTCSEPAEILVSGKRHVGSRQPRKLSDVETTWAQTYTPPAWLRPLVTVALRSGFRRRTLLSLEWGHLDLEHGRWTIPGEIMKIREDYSAPVPSSVLETLLSWQKRVLEEKGAAAVRPESRIFADLSPEAPVTRVFQRAARRAGLKGLTFHDCRRIFVNRLRESGVPLETAMKLSGHRSIAVVQKYYREIPWTDLEEAVRAADAKRSEARPEAAPAKPAGEGAGA
ncbi:MAG: site-specific integrase [Planctomycetes bacterium]|nr:site-specific integrase [Planctomycetota bacterium]